MKAEKISDRMSLEQKIAFRAFLDVVKAFYGESKWGKVLLSHKSYLCGKWLWVEWEKPKKEFVEAVRNATPKSEGGRMRWYYNQKRNAFQNAAGNPIRRFNHNVDPRERYGTRAVNIKGKEEQPQQRPQRPRGNGKSKSNYATA